jgi:hypothetical protein
MSGPIQPSLTYYLGLFTSEYQNSANLKAFATRLIQPFLDATACADSISEAFNLDTAVGVQLDALGTVIGISRTLPFTPLGVNALTTEAVSATGSQTVTVNNTLYMQIGVAQSIDSGANQENVTPTAIVQGVSFTAVFTKTHLTNVAVTTVDPSAVLGDSDYRTLLMARIIFNQFNGQYMGSLSILWNAWQVLYPGAYIFITDNQNMTATLFLVGAFTPTQQQMITNGLIVPRPQAVQFIYDFATLPLFGFDNLNPTFVEGFDLGMWN